MKSKAKIHSIDDDNVVRPLPYIDINKAFFEREGPTKYTTDSLLYQDVLKYGIKHTNEHGFRFSELANWLIRNNIEFINYYVDSKSRTPIYVRVGNRRQRIQSCLHNLIRLGLLIEKDKVEAERNNELTVLYDFTREGYLLGAIIQGEEKYVLNILESYSNVNDSFIMAFITRFFNKEFERGRFGFIIDFFVRTIVPQYRVENGRDLLKLFLGLRHSLNWIIVSPDTFFDTLYELDEETKKLALFHFKMEIEEYYKENYLVEELRIMEFHVRNRKIIAQRDDYSKLISVPGREWHLIRFNNISDYSTVTIPAFCGRCRTEGVFLYDTKRYLDCVIASYVRHSAAGVYGRCNKCSNDYGLSALVIRLPHFVTVW